MYLFNESARGGLEGERDRERQRETERERENLNQAPCLIHA